MNWHRGTGRLKWSGRLGKPWVFRAFVRGVKTIGGKLMRISILAILVAFGTAITIPATAQQQTGAQPQIGPDQQQMQKDADKGVKTRNSGESGYVADQEKPGASAHPPGKPDSQQTTTGSGTGSGDRSR
jgi:hypothetical protein